VRAAVADGRSRLATVSLDGTEMRLYAAPLARLGGPASGGAVVVAAPTTDLRETVRSLRLVTLVAALLAALLGGAAVALLTRRALQPLTALADSAAAIASSGDVRARLPEPESRDEVGRLAETLNGMLASLERSREGERRFLADASHELRTPLTALRGNVAYLARHGATPELVADLSHDAERLAALADDLLLLSREEAALSAQEPLLLDELARTASAGDARVDVDAPAHVWVRGDGASLERALANLLENARRYGPADGRIGIAVSQADGVAAMSVEDEGAGLAPEQSELAFSRFWRAGGDTAGSGLGLAIVRAIAERHGGRAYAAGARFTVELPALTPISESGATTTGKPEKGLP
jgi:signal transduction histidine kinase